jgi:lactoylglutathione lyase
MKFPNHIKSQGLTLDVEPKQGIDLNYQCWVKDPDGNRIEFMQMHPDSPQNKA